MEAEIIVRRLKRVLKRTDFIELQRIKQRFQVYFSKFSKIVNDIVYDQAKYKLWNNWNYSAQKTELMSIRGLIIEEHFEIFFMGTMSMNLIHYKLGTFLKKCFIHQNDESQ